MGIYTNFIPEQQPDAEGGQVNRLMSFALATVSIMGGDNSPIVIRKTGKPNRMENHP